MRIGLIGAQGVGKSTLAEAVSNETGLPLIFTRTSAVFQRLGLKPDQALPFDQRIWIQNQILDDAMELWSDHVAFVTDRTPLDMLAYTMIDINSDTRLTDTQVIEFNAYKQRCYSLTNEYFTTLVLVQPGIKAVEGEKLRASLDPVLCDVFNSLLLGLMMSDKMRTHCSLIPKNTLLLEKRVRSVMYSLHRSANELVKGLDMSVAH